MIKTKNIKQVVIFKGASTHEVYESLVDSAKHAKFTSSKAVISREIGETCSAYNGWIEAINVELIPDKKIMQVWRGQDWPKGHYSIVTFSLKKSGKDTELDFEQISVPEQEFDGINKGWKEQYWDKMKLELNK